MGEVILYASIASRSIAAYWMLEELGVPYRVVDVDLKEGKHKRPEYLAINPSGRVPAIAVDSVIVTERPAICALLADRFGYGTLAPKIDAPERGPYLKWLVYSTAVIDPAIAVYVSRPAQPLREMTWGSADHVVDLLAEELAGKMWLLGEWFTAADVAIGAVIVMALYNNQLPENATLRAYNDRIMARPAFQRAADLTWPPQLFPRA
jgi:glutathione S-transferase